VVNVMGRVFMLNIDDPFAVVLREIAALKERTRIVFVDFHAEATSEKIAMGWHLDGKVTAVVGTHTHVQTATNASCRRDGVPDRRRHDRPARFDHRRRDQAALGRS
jgi:calcineurin-like phosphoesterase